MRHGCLLVHANNAIFTALFITTEGLRWHYLHNQEQLWGTNIDDTRQKKIAGKKNVYGEVVFQKTFLYSNCFTEPSLAEGL